MSFSLSEFKKFQDFADFFCQSENRDLEINNSNFSFCEGFSINNLYESTSIAIGRGCFTNTELLLLHYLCCFFRQPIIPIH